MLLRFDAIKNKVNIINANNNDWGKAQKSYDNTYQGLISKAKKVQRPMLWYDNKGAPEVFYGGWIWSYAQKVNGALVPNQYGGSRSYPVQILA